MTQICAGNFLSIPVRKRIQYLIGSAVLIGGMMLPTTGIAMTATAEFDKQTGMILQEWGELSAGDRILESDGSLYDMYEFRGQAGQRVVIRMTSSEFDTYLGLLDNSGNLVAENDDTGGSTNSEIVVTLPSTGVYTVVANAYDSSGRGHYALTVE